MYFEEFAKQNIKLAFKLQDWLWFKKKIHYTAVQKHDKTVNLHELNKAPILLLAFTEFALVSVLHQ